jgi:hypothetical protein
MPEHIRPPPQPSEHPEKIDGRRTIDSRNGPMFPRFSPRVRWVHKAGLAVAVLRPTTVNQPVPTR